MGRTVSFVFSFLLGVVHLSTTATATSLITPPTPPPSSRIRQSFDFDWLFSLSGNEGPTCDASFFPINLTANYQCLGLTNVDALNPEECLETCCNSDPGTTCSVWQFSAENQGCWIGTSCADNITAGDAWVGGGRSSPAYPTVCTDPINDQCAPSYNDSTWTSLQIPHDFIFQTGEFSANVDPGHGALPRNTSWYRKHFNLDPSLEGQLIWLTFDGVFRNAQIYLNGALIKTHMEGYTSFIAYLHNSSQAPLLFGNGTSNENVLAVFVDATQLELWCYEGGGIYRHVWLESASPLSFVPFSFYTPSFVSGVISGDDATQPQTADGAVLLPQIDIQNELPSVQTGTVLFTLLEQTSGNVVANISVPFNVSGNGGWLRIGGGGGTGTSGAYTAMNFGSAVSPVLLWNTARSPPLYIVTAALLPSSSSSSTGVGSTNIDAVAVRTGIRSAVFDARLGFVLNGVKVPLQGTSNHIGFGGLGMSLPDRVFEYQIAMLRSMGSNAFRTAHNPVAPEVLDYADAYGMLVWEENRNVLTGPPVPASVSYGKRSVGRGASIRENEEEESNDISMRETQHATSILKGKKNKIHNNNNNNNQYRNKKKQPLSSPTTATADPRLLQDAQDMVLRDRNHPSIIVWSLCNELGCAADDPNGGVLAMQFKLSIYASDSSRPVTGNTVQSPYLSGKLVDSFAMAMDVQSFSYEYNAYTQYHEVAPYKPIGGGESASCVNDRSYYGPTNGTSGHVKNSGLFSCITSSWQPAMSVPYVYGSFAWTGFDYYGETYPLGFPDTSSHFGIFDLVGFAKDGVGYYTAWWRDAVLTTTTTTTTMTSTFVRSSSSTQSSGSTLQQQHEEQDTLGFLCKGVNNTISLAISPNHWTNPVAVNSAISVTLSTCANSVVLYLNGALQGGYAPITNPLLISPYGVATFPGVLYQPGNLTAVAFDVNNNIIATTTLLTAGSAYRLVMWIEEDVFLPSPNMVGVTSTTNGSTIQANGQDSALLGISLVDKDGILVPNADVNVTLNIEGNAGIVIGIANGDPSDRSAKPSQVGWKYTFGGLLRTVIRSSAPGVTGNIIVTAGTTAENGTIQPASVVLYAV